MEVLQSQRKNPILVTKRLVLRLAEESDVPELVSFFSRNDERLAPVSPSRPAHFYTEAYWIDRVNKSKEEWAAEQSLKFFIFNKDNNSSLIGSAGFTQMTRGPFQACYLGYAIDKDFEGQGLMREALEAAIQFVFSDLNFHRIMANHLPENIKSGTLLKRLGFVCEGKALDYLFIGGQWRDHMLTALINKNWRSV